MNEIQKLLEKLDHVDEQLTLQSALLKHSDEIIIDFNSNESKGFDVERGLSLVSDENLKRKVFIDNDGSIIFTSNFSGYKIKDFEGYEVQQSEPPIELKGVKNE